MSCDQFWLDRIEATKNQIIAYENAIIFLTENPTESYKLDTGQSEQEVKRTNLSNLQKTYDALLNRLTVLEKRCSSTSTISAPGW